MFTPIDIDSLSLTHLFSHSIIRMSDNSLIVVDSLFKSYRRCFIIDILNCDTSKYQKYKVVKINNQYYVTRVCIAGLGNLVELNEFI